MYKYFLSILETIFFIERFADWHEFQIYRPELSNTVIVYQYGNFFGNASLGFAEYMFVWNDKKNSF